MILRKIRKNWSAKTRLEGDFMSIATEHKIDTFPDSFPEYLHLKTHFYLNAPGIVGRPIIGSVALCGWIKNTPPLSSDYDLELTCLDCKKLSEGVLIL